MERFAQAAEAIGSRPGKLEKIELLAAYLRTLDDDDVPAAVRFFTGNPFAASDRRTLSLGGRSIVAVAKRVWDFDDASLGEAYRTSGDLGAALAPLVRPPRDAMLFSERLTPATLAARFAEIAAAAGNDAGKRREAVLERILRACDRPLVATYVVKIVTGDLRIGLREGLVVDAIARAFGAQDAAVRRAAMASGDLGIVAVAAKHGELERVVIAYGTPVGFMLASPVAFGESYKELAGEAWLLEDKYDGIRAQAHVRNGTVRLFSRTLNDVTAAYPEVATALASIGGDAIIDGEIVAIRDGRALPFRTLQTRLARKRVDDELLRDIPVAYAAFDLLAAGDDLLVDSPLRVRRAALERIVVPGAHLLLSPSQSLEDAQHAPAVNAAFEAARARGNEGLMLKRADSPYSPGRRGRWWLKVKRELATLDVVVVAVEWGHGKRAKVLSDYTFAVRGDDGTFAAIGKAYSGLTDAEISELTPFFLEHRLPHAHQRDRARSHEIPVEPKIVIEIAFDIIQQSDLHESGFSLRFPRIVRIRDDKFPTDVDTVERVRELYREMLAREGSS